MHFWRIAWRYYIVITVIFHYYTVSMHDLGNRNLVKSTDKCQGNIMEVHGAGQWSVITCKAYITIAIRLRFNYDTTIPRRIRLRRK